MTINNPFSNGQIKNYLLFYASVVLIMILFFIASSLFNDIKKVDKKSFDSEKRENIKPVKSTPEPEGTRASKFKLLDQAY